MKPALLPHQCHDSYRRLCPACQQEEQEAEPACQNKEEAEPVSAVWGHGCWHHQVGLLRRLAIALDPNRRTDPSDRMHCMSKHSEE